MIIAPQKIPTISQALLVGLVILASFLLASHNEKIVGMQVFAPPEVVDDTTIEKPTLAFYSPTDKTVFSIASTGIISNAKLVLAYGSSSSIKEVKLFLDSQKLAAPYEAYMIKNSVVLDLASFILPPLNLPDGQHRLEASVTLQDGTELTAATTFSVDMNRPTITLSKKERELSFIVEDASSDVEPRAEIYHLQRSSKGSVQDIKKVGELSGANGVFSFIPPEGVPLSDLFFSVKDGAGNINQITFDGKDMGYIRSESSKGDAVLQQPSPSGNTQNAGSYNCFFRQKFISIFTYGDNLPVGEIGGRDWAGALASKKAEEMKKIFSDAVAYLNAEFKEDGYAEFRVDPPKIQLIAVPSVFDANSGIYRMKDQNTPLVTLNDRIEDPPGSGKLYTVPIGVLIKTESLKEYIEWTLQFVNKNDEYDFPIVLVDGVNQRFDYACGMTAINYGVISYVQPTEYAKKFSSCDGVNQYLILAHEMGHLLGLDHVPYAQDNLLCSGYIDPVCDHEIPAKMGNTDLVPVQTRAMVGHACSDTRTQPTRSSRLTFREQIEEFNPQYSLPARFGVNLFATAGEGICGNGQLGKHEGPDGKPLTQDDIWEQCENSLMFVQGKSPPSVPLATDDMFCPLTDTEGVPGWPDQRLFCVSSTPVNQCRCITLGPSGGGKPEPGRNNNPPGPTIPPPPGKKPGIAITPRDPSTPATPSMPPICGDGIVQSSNKEECDPPGSYSFIKYKQCDGGLEIAYYSKRCNTVCLWEDVDEPKCPEEPEKQ